MRLVNNLILMSVAVLLLIVVSPLALLWSVTLILFRPRTAIDVLSNLMFAIAKCIDVFSNVIFYPFLNALLIREDSSYPFGEEYDTISKVLGKNKMAGNLTKLGVFVSDILNKIDPYHVEDASEDTNFCG